MTSKLKWGWFAGLVLAAGLPAGASRRKGSRFRRPAPTSRRANPATAVAVFAGGCFWGVQGVFQHVDGVESAVSGYAGGAADTARYRAVGSGRTGHAEAVEVTYDPDARSATARCCRSSSRSRTTRPS